MLLGTFQVDQELEWQRRKYSALENEIGFFPRFCFGAASPADVIKYGMMAAPNSVDNLFIFDSDDFIGLDVVNWNRYLVTKDKDDLRKAIGGGSGRCDYLVRDITKIRYHLRPQKWMPKSPVFSTCFDSVRARIDNEFGDSEAAAKYCGFLKKQEEEFIGSFLLPTLNREFENDYQRLIASIFLFKFDYLSFHYALNTFLIDARSADADAEHLESEIPKLPVFDWQLFLGSDVRAVLRELMNADEPLERKTDGTYDTVCAMLDSCISPFSKYL